MFFLSVNYWKKMYIQKHSMIALRSDVDAEEFLRHAQSLTVGTKSMVLAYNKKSGCCHTRNRIFSPSLAIERSHFPKFFQRFLNPDWLEI